MHLFDAAEIASIEADVVQDTYDFTGGGPKTNVHTKEYADHSLSYLLAVALIDGDVQPALLSSERIAKPGCSKPAPQSHCKTGQKLYRPLSSRVRESGDGATQERSVVQP
jgi:hypothetical protein